ncbi:MAG: TraX family protein [Oscillospiraceae bacterium]
MDNTLENRPLTANALKLIAVAAMLIDHIAWAFVELGSPLGQIMHFIGRFTAPIMCHFISEGYHYTKSLLKYMLRLGIFALISHFPFVMNDAIIKPPIYFSEGRITVNPEMFVLQTGVIFTLLLGLIALALCKSKANKFVKVIGVIIISLLACYGDWMFFTVLWIIGFGMNRGNIKRQFICYYMIALVEMSVFFIPVLVGRTPFTEVIWQFGVLIPPLLILLYNGKKGAVGKALKYFYYWFYPVHLLIIGVLKWYVFI